MSNMSYCRHENTANDLAEVVAQWDEWTDDNEGQRPEDREAQGRRTILQLAVDITRRLEELGLVDVTDQVTPGAEREYLALG